MAKVFKEYLEWTEGKLCEDGRPFPERWCFYCPGCKAHYLNIKGEDAFDDREATIFSLHVLNTRDIHTFNGDADNPTFGPSLLVKRHDKICHSYVRDGKIEYLADSTHPLAGQTIDLPEIPEEYLKI